MKTLKRLKFHLATLLTFALIFSISSSANAWVSQSGVDGFGEPEGRLETYFIAGEGPTDKLSSNLDWSLLLLCLNQEFQIFVDDLNYGNLSGAKVEVKFSKNGRVIPWKTKSRALIKGDKPYPYGFEFLEPKKLAREMEKTNEFYVRISAPKFIPPQYGFNFKTAGLKKDKKIFKKNCAW